MVHTGNLQSSNFNLISFPVFIAALIKAIIRFIIQDILGGVLTELQYTFISMSLMVSPPIHQYNAVQYTTTE